MTSVTQFNITEGNSCNQQYDNASLSGSFCSPLEEDGFCWPLTQTGKSWRIPCEYLREFDPEVNLNKVYFVKYCQENGEWTKTDTSLCDSFLEKIVFQYYTVPTVTAYINVIVSSISLILLLISLLIFCYFKSLQCSRLKVHCNLSVALIMYHIFLIVQWSPLLSPETHVKVDWLCKCVLVMQRYSAMASINWMFVEGLLLHCKVTTHIFRQDAPFKLYYFIGWCLPAILVSSWALTMNYVLSKYCWVGYSSSPYIWIVTGPMLTALVVNTIFLINIIRVLIAGRHAQVNTDTAQVRKAIKATALLFPLLGLTHLLFCVKPDDVYGEVAYRIINAFIGSSQGIFVAILYCFMNTDVQSVLRKAYLRSAIRRNPNYRSNRRGMSQTSASTYISNSDGLPTRAIIRLQDHQVVVLPPKTTSVAKELNKNNTTKAERTSIIF